MNTGSVIDLAQSTKSGGGGCEDASLRCLGSGPLPLLPDPPDGRGWAFMWRVRIGGHPDYRARSSRSGIVVAPCERSPDGTPPIAAIAVEALAAPPALDGPGVGGGQVQDA